jgi:hypothetical protein
MRFDHGGNRTQCKVASLRVEGPLERIEPSLWRQREIDLMTESDGCKYFVSVSETELCHWLKTKQHSKASSPPRKRDLVKQAINELWQNGVPKDLLNKQIETQVRDWITAYCKHEKLPKLEISRETILRAAGRRK